MDPAIAKKLMSQVPEMKGFVAFLIGEVKKLDMISTIESKVAEEIAIEVAGRKQAITVLTEIMKPLINTQDMVGSDMADYVV